VSNEKLSTFNTLHVEKVFWNKREKKGRFTMLSVPLHSLKKREGRFEKRMYYEILISLVRIGLFMHV
jgi:hypothetical protein